MVYTIHSHFFVSGRDFPKIPPVENAEMSDGGAAAQGSQSPDDPRRWTTSVEPNSP